MVYSKKRLLRKKSLKKRINKNNRKTKNYKSKHRTNKYYGGIAEYTETAVSDTTKLLDHYLVKRIVNGGLYDSVLNKTDYNTLSFTNKDLLIVIDMQNDFVDAPVKNANGEDLLTGPYIPTVGKLGAFCVNNGASIINPIVELVKKFKTNNGNVVFTRDVHTCNHCSFDKSVCQEVGQMPTIDLNPTGPFPPHCVNKTTGSGFVKEIKEYLTGTEVVLSSNLEDGKGGQISVVFKGCDTNTDSFGAFQYNDDEYGRGRQIACKPKDLSKTGGFYAMNQDDYINKKVIEDEFDAVSAITDTSNPLPKFLNKFEIPNSIENIYVVGLAGDWCVCDTALNLKSAYPTKNVSVIYELTRNAFIPFVKPNDATLTSVKEIKKDKTLDNYAFVYNEQGNVRSLNQDEIKGLNAPEDLAPEALPKFHFLTDINALFDRYKENKVKVVLKQSTIDDASKAIEGYNPE